MLYTREASGSVEEVGRKLEAAAAENKFGVLAVHDLRETMKKKGVDFDRECRIYEVCNPGQAKKVLETDMAISTALPCRISVYQQRGKTAVAMLRPSAMLASFDKPELEPVAKDVEATMIRIIDAACR
jgi:uncharacterized protein (DUF302 family)